MSKVALASPRLVLACVLLVAGVAVYLILFAPWRPHGGQSLHKLDADFCRTMPVGSTEESVLRFLSERKENHSVPKAGDHSISAYLGNTGITGFFTCSTEVRFAFGDDNRLSKCYVSQACDGP
jgi:hypothetical protein